MKYYPVVALFDCIQSNRKWAPKGLTFKVSGNLISHHDDEKLTVIVVPTCIRMTYSETGENPGEYVFERPDFEFEGWLLGDYREKIWVLGVMTCSVIEGPDELTLYRLSSGAEMGTDPTPDSVLSPGYPR